MGPVQLDRTRPAETIRPALPAASPAVPRGLEALGPHSIGALQRLAGNSAVAGLLARRGSREPRAVPTTLQLGCRIRPQECPCTEAPSEATPEQVGGPAAQRTPTGLDSTDAPTPPGDGERLPVQRKIAVHDPTGAAARAPSGETNEKIVRSYMAALCSGFNVTGGRVEPTGAAFCPAGAAGSSTPETCKCLCKMHRLGRTWTIKVDDNDWPHTEEATRIVTVHSPFSGIDFGAWSKGPPAHRMTYQNWLVLAHEMCGHAELMSRRAHPTGPAPTHGGRPSHDVTVQIENKIAAEHGISASELRGLFADPHHGESFARITVAEFGYGSSDVSTLPAGQKRQLDIAETFIKSAPVKMDVVGHEDKPGTAPVKAMISKKRADAVQAELVARGISLGRFLDVRGVGDADCPSPGPQPRCRKAEVFMFIMEGASVTHP